MKKMFVRFFTIADYNEEEFWLREQHKKGLKLVKTVVPCFYFFESVEPEDVIYRLDFKNKTASEDYKQMYKDYGWEYFNACMGWNYFRKSASDVNGVNDGEIFSDNESKIEMLNKVIRNRMLPLIVILLCCVLPNLNSVLRHMDGNPFLDVFNVIIVLLFIADAYICLHCSVKIRKLKKNLEK